MKTSKTLSDFVSELQDCFFDKRKINGIVKRATNAGFEIYSAYHEDNENTWKTGWSQNDYRNNESDVKLFEATNLIQKKKQTFRSFQKAATYTAECAIFVFAPLREIMNDKELRSNYLAQQRKLSDKYAEANFERACKNLKEIEESKEHLRIWEETISKENKAEIEKLESRINEISGQSNSRKPKAEMNLKIIELGGRKPKVLEVSEWEKEVFSFGSIEEYKNFKFQKRVEAIHKEIKEETELA